jgi:hypothetical protein
MRLAIEAPQFAPNPQSFPTDILVRLLFSSYKSNASRPPDSFLSTPVKLNDQDSHQDGSP